VLKLIKRPVFQITLLTFLFAGLYAGLRAMPGSTCNFLHYEQTVVTADGLQFCGSGAAYFVNLDSLPFPVTVKLTADRAPAVGQTTHFTLQLETPNRPDPLRPSELAVTQTQLLHLLLVDPSLEDYQHIHPVPDGESGSWTFDFTPKLPGAYKVYAQFIPTLSMREMIGQTEIVVPGESAPGVRRGLAPFKDGDYVFHLASSASPAVAGTETTLTLTVQRADGGKVDLQEIMGTVGHMVAFDDGRHGVAHLHPTLTGKERDPLQPTMAFLVNLLEPGRYRLWAQVKLDDRERYIPFDLEVAKN
jgi:hypothetical protein